MEEKVYTLSEREWEEYCSLQNWQQALRQAGVDNWEGYDFAMEAYRELEGMED